MEESVASISTIIPLLHNVFYPSIGLGLTIQLFAGVIQSVFTILSLLLNINRRKSPGVSRNKNLRKLEMLFVIRNTVFQTGDDNTKMKVKDSGVGLRDVLWLKFRITFFFFLKNLRANDSPKQS